MLHIYQNRFLFGDDATISTLHIGSEFKHFILEDEVREGEKVYGETAIPYGTYEVELRDEGGLNQKYGARFSDESFEWLGMIHLLNVPNFKWIQMHPGNKESHTDGCPIPGFDPKRVDDKNNYELYDSSDAFRLSYPIISKKISEDGRALWHVSKFRAF